MKLDKVTSGAVYVDTNILYMYLRADPIHLPAIMAFLRRVIQGDTEALVGIPVLKALRRFFERFEAQSHPVKG